MSLHGCLIAGLLAVGVALSPTLTGQPPQAPALNLSGVWESDGARILVRSNGGTVTSAFCSGGTTVSGQTLPFFIRGSLSQTVLSGDMMRGASDALVKRGANQSFSTPFVVPAATEDRMDGTMKMRSYVVQVRGGKRVLVESQSNQDAPFTMTRVPCEEALRDEIEEVNRQLPVKQAVTQALTHALTSPPAGKSWNEVYESVRQQVNQGTGGAAPAQYGCEVVTEYVPDNVPLRQTSLRLSLNCGNATGLVREMGEAHERGHFADLNRAFGDFKKGVWSEQRYTDYVEGTSRVAGDVARRIKEELDRHAGDVTFLQTWLAQATASYDALCVKC